MSIQADEPRIVVDVRCDLGEGAIWDDRAALLYWVDIAGRTLNHFDPAHGQNRSMSMGEQVSTVVPTVDDGQVLVGLENSVAVVNAATGERLREVPLEADMPENRCNDGKCGPGGRFYIGTMSTVRRIGTAALYRVDHDYSVDRCFGGVTVSNGICWSTDGRTAYYIDTPTTNIDILDCDPESGTLSNRRSLIAVPAEYGKPDGMTIDSEGRLWVAMFHGACVTVWDPENAELVEKIDVPAKNVTSVAFGDADLSTLYITTAKIGLGRDDIARYPGSGALFAMRTTTTGRPPYRFGDTGAAEAPAAESGAGDELSNLPGETTESGPNVAEDDPAESQASSEDHESAPE